MKFMNFFKTPEVFPSKAIENKVIDWEGNPEEALNQELYSVLSDPEFIKTFPGPGDFQYDLLRQGLISSEVNAKNGFSYLKKFILTTDYPLFTLTRFTHFLNVAIGNIKKIAEKNKQYSQIANIAEAGLLDISNAKDTPYFLGINLRPSIILKPVESFTSKERALTPVQISNKYFIQDNGHDPFPIFYEVSDVNEFLKIIESQKEMFRIARPENRPHLPDKASLKEYIAFDKKYLKPHLNIDSDIDKHKTQIKNSSRRLSVDEIIKLFPHAKNVMDLIEDPIMFEFRAFVDPAVRHELNNDFGINFNNIPITEQIYFLSTISKKTNETIKPVKTFVKKYKEIGLRTFLSVEHGGKEMGDKILTLGEKLPEDSAKVLFKTYSEMVDATEEVGDILRDNLGEKATPELIEDSKLSLLLAGKNLLERYSGKANTCEGVECENIGKELEERLALAKKSVFAFSYACKTLVEKGEFNFEDFKKAKLIYDQSPLPEVMQEKIIAMHEVNTEQYPEKLKLLWRGTLKNGLKNPNPNQLVVSVSYGDDVVSAMRVIKRGDGSWYGASFNVNPTVQGSKVGSELLKKVIEDLAKDKPFVADCYSKNPMLDTYINKFGFRISKEIENYEGTGELVYEITLDPKKVE